MKKFALISAILAVCFLSVASADTCSKSSIFTLNEVPDSSENKLVLSDMTSECVDSTRKQIQTEIGASLKYLSMAVHFSQDNVNLPGFAKFFFDAASEEREHAYKLMEYLSMRGTYLTDKLTGSYNIVDGVKGAEKQLEVFMKKVGVSKVEDITGIDALKIALEMEKFVTNSIRNLIKVCEKEEEPKSINHYHFVDYLTGEFLEEQYKGQRDIAGKISTLGKMFSMHSGKKLAEFLFDKQL